MRKQHTVILFGFAAFMLILVNCSRFDPETQYQKARELELSRHQKEAIVLLKKVIRKSKGKNLYYKAQVSLGRNYYYNDEFDKAREVCEKLLVSLPDSIDPGIDLDARMILLSIEREIPVRKGDYLEKH